MTLLADRVRYCEHNAKLDLTYDQGYCEHNAKLDLTYDQGYCEHNAKLDLTYDQGLTVLGVVSITLNST